MIFVSYQQSMDVLNILYNRKQLSKIEISKRVVNFKKKGDLTKGGPRAPFADSSQLVFNL